MSADGCFATVLIDDELWRSLVAFDGQHPAAWVHGCALEHDHGGDHRSPPYRAGGQVYWVQWDESRKPRLITAAEPTPPGRNAHTQVEPPDQARPSPRPATAHAFRASVPEPEQPDGPKSTSQTDALWAIAAAERIADAIAGAFNSGESRGRHRDDVDRT